MRFALLTNLANAWSDQKFGRFEMTLDTWREPPAPKPPANYPSAYSPSRTKRILILSVSAGAGHVRAAEAIRSYADAHDPDTMVTHLDVMDYVPTPFRKIYTDFYLALVNRHPALWGYLYHLTNEAKPGGKLQMLRRAIERLNTKALRKKIASADPDAIVCTHFLPAELLARMTRNQRLTCAVWVQVTDFDLHRMWVHEHMAGYFAANEEVAYRMRGQGIPANRIHVTGIPIMPAFGQEISRSECARAFGFDPGKMTILLMGGGAGIGRLDEVAARLLALNDHCQLIALAGKNLAVLNMLQALAAKYPGRLLAQGYTHQVERLMACADLVVTKPGGLTISECLAMGLPMIVNEPIPGQEERNADFLLEHGVALKASDAVTLEYRIRYLLQRPAKLAEMRERARALGRPSAARSVLNTVLGRFDS
jgi:processive 1,2-diacylglycerol beta-glucosyltransferase